VRRWASAIVVGLLAGCGSASTDSGAPTTAIPRQLLAEARPIGVGPRFQPRAAGPVVGPCAARLGARFGAHVELFAANRVVVVPSGIGTLPPRALTEGRISAARCYGSLVTLEPTGLVLVRPGTRLTVADLFRAFGQPLSSSRLVSFSGRVAVFVGGRRLAAAPGSVPLSRHAEIVLEVGPHVPPHSSYTFPPGT
jgi:hypothetical protein